MRKIALVKNHNADIKRVMLYEDKYGIFLFGYKKLEDGGANWDQLYQTIETLYEDCEEEYGIKKEDWKDIPDPLKDCQHDWIEPVRIKGRDKGKPEWGKLEKLVNGIWVDIP